MMYRSQIRVGHVHRGLFSPPPSISMADSDVEACEDCRQLQPILPSMCSTVTVGLRQSLPASYQRYRARSALCSELSERPLS